MSNWDTNYRLGMSSDPRANIQNQGYGAMLGGDRALGDYARAQQDQQGALGMYRQAAMGQGPSAAGSMLQQGHEQAQANAAALAHQTRGGNAAGANRAALAAQHAGAAQASHAAMQQAAMDQQAGMQGYAGMANAMAGQSLGQQQAYMGQQNAMLGMQLSDDQHRRQQALMAKQYKTNRNMGWAQFGTQTGMGVLEGIFGGAGG
jgi:hypothetical protein